MKRKLTVLSLCVLLVAILPISISNRLAPESNCTFVIADWDYPDEYGQGIRFLEIYGNSTGSWVKVGGNHYYDETILYEWNSSVAIKIRCWTDFNSTLTGSATTNEGKLYHRHNVSVVDRSLNVVFSQQNFTFYEVLTEGAPMWLYAYEVVLNFLPQQGQYYVATINYEVFGAW